MGTRSLVFGLASLASCVALNPVYEDGGGTSGAGTTSEPSGTSQPKTEDTGAGTSDETSQGPKGTTTTFTSGSPSTETGPHGSTDVDPDDTGVEPGDTGTDSAPVEPALTVVIFASAAVQGDFASAATVLEGGAGVCTATAEEDGLGLACDAMLPIIAPAGVSFEDVVATTPELDSVPLFGPDVELVADSFGSLLSGDVEVGFGPRVTEHLGGFEAPPFWWTPEDASGPDCNGWTSTAETMGRTRVFDSSGSGAVFEEANACNQLHHLLCACLMQD